MENIDKQTCGRNHTTMIDENVYDERNQIGENGEDRSTDDVKVLKLGKKIVPKEIYIILKTNLMK